MCNHRRLRLRHLSILMPLIIFIVIATQSEVVSADEEVQPALHESADDSVQEEITLTAAADPLTDSSMWKLFVPRKIAVNTTGIIGGGDDALNSGRIDLSTSFFAPFPWLNQSFLSVSPSFGYQYLDGPDGVELPSNLYRGGVSFSLMKTLNERTQLMLGLSPSFASDLHATDGAFRFMSFGNIAWQSTPTRKWMFGVAVTGRDDIPVLPMAGVILTPNNDWQIDITAPRPRISYRLGGFEGSDENWIYLAGEFGGGTWAVDRSGVDDDLTLRDFRLVLGWEQRDKTGMNPRVEVGYVFGRNIEYESDDYEFQPSDAVMVRAALSF